MTENNQNKSHLWSSEDQRMLVWYRKDDIRQMMMEEFTPEEFWEKVTERAEYAPIEKDFAYMWASYDLQLDTKFIRLFGNKER